MKHVNAFINKSLSNKSKEELRGRLIIKILHQKEMTINIVDGTTIQEIKCLLLPDKDSHSQPEYKIELTDNTITIAGNIDSAIIQLYNMHYISKKECHNLLENMDSFEKDEEISGHHSPNAI